MTASLQDDLAALTGEELYHLTLELDRAIGSAEIECPHYSADPERFEIYAQLAVDLVDVRTIVHAQIARITIPIGEAASIIYRVRYSRNHPVRVPGT